MSDRTWYVCYQPRDPYRGPKECRRHSETFSNELEAKAFAKSSLADARKITAGTHQPALAQTRDRLGPDHRMAERGE
jgi:hypothetical protein